MKDLQLKPEDRVLIIGGTGFVGRRLVAELIGKRIKLRLLIRDPVKASSLVPKGTDIQVMSGDLVENRGLREALQGIHTAYYLVHSLGGRAQGPIKTAERQESLLRERSRIGISIPQAGNDSPAQNALLFAIQGVFCYIYIVTTLLEAAYEIHKNNR